MPKFRLNKLVRDGLPAKYEQLDQKATGHKLADGELKAALLRKIIEEAEELLREDEITAEEVADLAQAFDDFIGTTELSEEEIQAVKEKKKAEKGGFLGGNFIEFLELYEDDEWVEYYRQDPERFLEIKDDVVGHMFDIPDVELGEYIHTKSGKHYEVLGVVCDSETLEWRVMYKPLYEHEGMPDVWVRPYDMFFEEVEIDGARHPRFQKVDNKKDA